MTKELEIAAVAALAGSTGRIRKRRPHSERCLDCGATLQGPYCHNCGQNADNHHRSILHLSWEAIEGLTHLDGRIARTLPALLFRPGALASDYVSGRLTRHIPPLRLFLVSLLIFMLSTEFIVRRGMERAQANTATANAQARAQAALAHGSAFSIQTTNGQISGIRPATSSESLEAVNASKALRSRGENSPQAKWLREHLSRAIGNPQLYVSVVFEWAHRLAFLLLPILAGELTLLYVYRRRFFVYDHLLVALQYLSFCFLLWAAVWLLPWSVQGWVFWPALIWTPTNLFLTLRGAYGSSTFGAVIKALVLWVSTLAAFGLLIAGLLALALGQV